MCSREMEARRCVVETRGDDVALVIVVIVDVVCCRDEAEGLKIEVEEGAAQKKECRWNLRQRTGRFETGAANALTARILWSNGNACLPASSRVQTFDTVAIFEAAENRLAGGAVSEDMREDYLPQSRYLC